MSEINVNAYSTLCFHPEICISGNMGCFMVSFFNQLLCYPTVLYLMLVQPYELQYFDLMEGHTDLLGYNFYVLFTNTILICLWYLACT